MNVFLLDSTDGGNEEELAPFGSFDEHEGRFVGKNHDQSDYNYSAEYDQDYEVSRMNRMH